jgi:hypothetical protein
MPAKSKKQQRFMGMVHAAQKGEKPASPEVAKVAKSIDPEAAEEFASTKHKGLPEKKIAEDLEAILSELEDPSEILKDPTIRKAFPSWVKKPPRPTGATTVDEPVAEPRATLKDVVDLTMRSLEPEDIARLISILKQLRRHPDAWRRPYESAQQRIAAMIDEDPNVIPEPSEVEKKLYPGRKLKWKPSHIKGLGSYEPEDRPKKKMLPSPSTKARKKREKEVEAGEPHDPSMWPKKTEKIPEPKMRPVKKKKSIEDKIKEGEPYDPSMWRQKEKEEVGEVDESMRGGEPMTEQGPEGGHKCKLCGGECGADMACDTGDCPNNREETVGENVMKKMELIRESATGRLSARTFRMLNVASGGRVLTEDEWKNKVGDGNYQLADELGLFKVLEEKVIDEKCGACGAEEGPPKGGEAVKEQPPVPGAEEGPPEETPETPEAPEGYEEEEEEEPISMHELAKFLEVLQTRTDEEASAMIDRAIASEEVGGEEMGGEEVEGMEMGSEGEGTTDIALPESADKKGEVITEDKKSPIDKIAWISRWKSSSKSWPR